MACSRPTLGTLGTLVLKSTEAYGGIVGRLGEENGDERA